MISPRQHIETLDGDRMSIEELCRRLGGKMISREACLIEHNVEYMGYLDYATLHKSALEYCRVPYKTYFKGSNKPVVVARTGKLKVENLCNVRKFSVAVADYGKYILILLPRGD